MRCGRSYRLQEYFRRRGSNVQVDVVERRIIQQAITAAECGLAITGQETTPLRRVHKAHGRPKAVLRSRDGWQGANAERQGRVPEGGCRVALTLGGDVIEDIGGLTIVRPGQASLYCKVLRDLPVIAAIQEGVILAEIESRGSFRNANAVRRVVEVGVPVGETVSAVDGGQEDIWRTLVGPVHTGFNLVLAQYPVPVVLRLPGIHNALLRQVGSRTVAQQTAGGKAHIGDRLVQLLRRRC